MEHQPVILAIVSLNLHEIKKKIVAEACIASARWIRQRILYISYNFDVLLLAKSNDKIQSKSIKL